MANAAIHFRVHRSALLPALEAVIEAVDAKSTIPILSNVLLRPDGGNLAITGTNLNIEIQTSCELLDAGEGQALTLSGSDLRDIARKLPESAELTFSPGAFQGQVIIKAGRSRFALLSLPDSDFPSIASKAQGVSVEIDSTAFMAALGTVVYAAKEDEVRPYLSGIFLNPEAEEDKIAVVGTDGHKLAMTRIAANGQIAFPSIIIPLRTIKALKKVAGDTKAPLRLTISEAMIKVECGSTVLISKLVDGTYPDYRRVIPAHNEKEVLASVDTLRAAIGRVCIMANDKGSNTVRMAINENAIIMQLVTPQGEEGEEEIAAEYDGEEIHIGFNGKYLMSMLDSIATSDLRMFLSDKGTAGLFKPSIDSDELHVLMPMRF
ncbi:DNA polymerase III subunit beta [Rhizobium sp. VS19-DR104.2]|uniref:DNA polymerase III subunit beta n=1 Tax=unclassified Rhizobium TaxID=2613769 RepID=UPI001CC8055B|nr:MULTISPECIES: DNA polymerase III subunit beta [unclassified Rhizobium]MBZ5760250.1 DNA polymerase III subunit beta [Rhizobium sp. VS19-DR96]MBZ5766906.1 DNA polymerase III subunit beta [Rhizobium sp. VS19-DR129.2]MBZ5773101.1 DNA polymerase III subunit beta [Rhizobium sp. VS19-DRK62.2]MBZ5784085.1 DNA polymerase III subunit beta [Rhizobium sp. VS19-DR121]MBZ5802445.1 DNA polymerase III subunit beta [Rhizobium sp. VS19-DR181]